MFIIPEKKKWGILVQTTITQESKIDWLTDKCVLSAGVDRKFENYTR